MGKLKTKINDKVYEYDRKTITLNFDPSKLKDKLILEFLDSQKSKPTKVIYDILFEQLGL